MNQKRIWIKKVQHHQRNKMITLISTSMIREKKIVPYHPIYSKGIPFNPTGRRAPVVLVGVRVEGVSRTLRI